MRLAEVELLLLSEPAKLGFDHLLLSSEGGEVEEVESLARLTYGRTERHETQVCRRVAG